MDSKRKRAKPVKSRFFNWDSLNPEPSAAADRQGGLFDRE
jgi:hypothetical protein